MGLIAIEYVLQKRNKQIFFELFDLDSPLFCPRHHINKLSAKQRKFESYRKFYFKI